MPDASETGSPGATSARTCGASTGRPPSSSSHGEPVGPRPRVGALVDERGTIGVRERGGEPASDRRDLGPTAQPGARRRGPGTPSSPRPSADATGSAARRLNRRPLATSWLRARPRPSTAAPPEGRRAASAPGRRPATRCRDRRAAARGCRSHRTRLGRRSKVAPSRIRAADSAHVDGALVEAGGAVGHDALAASRSAPRRRRRWRAPAAVCEPDGASQSYRHCTQVSIEIAVASVAARHGPSSTCTSTPSMPTCWCQATPATHDRSGRRAAGP